MLHPAIARIKCSDCFKFSYNFETGERETFLGVDGTRVDVERPRTVPPPCHNCPKGSPENEENCTLSEKNLATLILYRQMRATGGRCLWDHEAADELLASNM